MLQSLSMCDVEDGLEHNICCTQTMQTQIAAEMSKLQVDPAQKAEQADQMASLQAKDQHLAEIRKR